MKRAGRPGSEGAVSPEADILLKIKRFSIPAIARSPEGYG
jgi:hypothetical protein